MDSSAGTAIVPVEAAPPFDEGEAEVDDAGPGLGARNIGHGAVSTPGAQAAGDDYGQDEDDHRGRRNQEAPGRG